MVRRGASGAGDGQVFDYRHPRARRKYIPPAGIESQRRIAERPAERYSYNPHLTPVLRFDPTGRADEYLALVQAARTRKLTAAEVQLLAEAPPVRRSGDVDRLSAEVDRLSAS